MNAKKREMFVKIKKKRKKENKLKKVIDRRGCFVVIYSSAQGTGP
jgi:hypothetical protein